MCKQLMAGLIVLGLTTGSASAAAGFFGSDPRNTVAGVVANGIIADGEGVDWTGAVLKIDLFSGSVYNDAGFGADGAPSSAFFSLLPALQWDSYVGIIDDPTAGIAGGAGDLGGGLQNLSGTGIDAASITWFNTRTTDTGPILIGNISLSDDAAGFMSIIFSFADGTLIQKGITIIGGSIGLSAPPLPPPYPEPGTLGLLGLGGLGLMRRGRRARL